MEIDIQQKIVQDFGQASSIAIDIIDTFEQKFKLSPRVSRCIIYLSNGDIYQLKKAIYNAEIDWRDVIVLAESKDLEFNKPFKLT